MGVYLPYIPKLPSEYQEVEYIESSNTQYIKIGNSWNSSYKTEIVMQITGSTDVLYGIRDNASPVHRYGLRGADGYFKGVTGSTSGISQTTFPLDTNKHNISLYNGTLTIDGNSYSVYNTSNVSFSNGLAIFGYTAGSSSGAASYFRVFSFKAYNGTTLLYDLVPCYRKSDGVIGLYDLVNSVFYTNSGTGTFSKGNDVTMSELKNAYIGEVWTPGSNTIGYWTFDDQNANQITDFSGNGNNLTGNTMPTYVQVLGSNYAGNYNNVSSGGTPYYSGTIDSNKFTVMLWLKVLATGQQYITDMWNGSIDNLPALIYGYNSGQIELYSYQNGNTYRSTIKSSTALDTWYCVGFTRNGTTMKTYLNGTYVASVTIPVVSGLNSFYVGSTGSLARFHGQIGEVVLNSGVEEDLSYMSKYYNLTKSNYGL